MLTKSGIMVGLGETREELLEVMDSLRAVEVDILTIGQYLQPTKEHLPIARFYHPDEFAALAEEGYARGFKWVESAPLVRSSYHADGQARIIQPRG
jgi:lipoic acid synthetase